MNLISSLRLKPRSMVAAIMAAVMLTALAAGNVLAEDDPMASDGQTLSSQPPEVQILFVTHYGDDAETQWVREHNAAIGYSMDGMGMDAQKHPLYDKVFHVAYQRSGDMDLARDITESVIMRGTIEDFLAGRDMGVIHGYVGMMDDDMMDDDMMDDDMMDDDMMDDDMMDDDMMDDDMMDDDMMEN